MIGKDPFPSVASINTYGFDFKALMNSKKKKAIPPSIRIRKLWIPKQYLTYKNYLTLERGVFAVIEKKKNGKNPNHSLGKYSMG